MAARREKIVRDVEDLLNARQKGELPRLQTAVLNDDTLVFVIDDGEFTACIADPYPSGQTEVYGPEEFELHSSGSILHIVQQVLAELEDCEGHTESAMEWIVQELRPEAMLQHDVTQVKKILGEDAIAMTQLGLEFWRLRLQVPVRQTQLSKSVCSAWGIDITRCISVELCLPTSGYVGIESVSGSMIKRIWQEGFPDFALESQLLQILRDFCNCKAEPEVINLEEQPPVVDLVSDSPDLDHRKVYETKKWRLIRTALGGLSSNGFLICLAHYLQLRVPTVHEFCAICDQPFNLPPMMMRTVCSNELCAYQFGEFGSKITTAESVNHPSEILDLLMCMLFAAGTSTRRTDVLDPYPLVQVGQSEGGCILHPQRKDFNKVESLVKELQILRSKLGEKMGASWALCTSQMSVEAAALLKWTAASNRSYLAPLEDNQRLDAFRTPFQYVLLSAPPEKEKRFQELKKEFGTSFAFHGSSHENWHSILRNGLKNASNTKLMTSGAAHGPGIYLATDIMTSIHYTRANRKRKSEKVQVNDASGVKQYRTGNRFVDNIGGLIMVAVCEVINEPVQLRKPTAGIWVATKEEIVCTRFFLVFSGCPEASVVLTGELEKDLHALADKARGL